jgi:hypothetical protein
MTEKLLFVHHGSAKRRAYFLDIANEAKGDAPIAQKFPEMPK